MKVMVADRKGQILREATRLFADSGFDKVTIKALADACSITEPALYRHFPSKEAIYDAVLDSIEERLSSEAVFTQLENERDLETLLRTLAHHVLSFFTTNRDIYRLLLYSALRDHAKAKRVYEMIRGVYVNFLERKLDRLYADNLIIRKNNLITARCFVGMVFDCALGATLWKNFQGKNYKPREIIDNNVPIYVRGLQSRE